MRRNTDGDDTNAYDARDDAEQSNDNTNTDDQSSRADSELGTVDSEGTTERGEAMSASLHAGNGTLTPPQVTGDLLPKGAIATHPLTSSANLTEEQLSAEQQRKRAEWRAWLVAQMMTAGYGALVAGGARIEFKRLADDMALRQPQNTISEETLKNLVRPRKGQPQLPSHKTAKALAQFFGVSEVAILLHSGQMDLSAVIPMLGASPVHFYNQQEYEATRASLLTIPNERLRERSLDKLELERGVSVWMERAVAWFGISAPEWNEVRQYLNTPQGRYALLRDMGYDQQETDTEVSQEPYPMSDSALPAEYLRRRNSDPANNEN